MTYIDTREVWIDGQFRENSLEHVQPGDEVEVIFDILPGRVFTAHIASVGFGVSSGKTDPQTGLPVVDEQAGWFRDPQRLPVRIEFTDDERPRVLRYGSQATIMVFTDDNPILNGLGRLWMRIVSILSYLR
jgi:multidrug resistance efflux pump